MSKKNESSEETKKPFSNPTVLAAIIGVIGTILVTLITTSPQIIAALKPPTETATSTVSIPATNTPVPVMIESLPTATSTDIPPTPTETIAPSPTPVDPGTTCLDRWEIISSEASLVAPGASGDCKVANIPGLGITTSNAGLSFGQGSFREQGLFGIATSIPANATIRLRVEMTTLTQGEFWIALSNTPQPDASALIFALQSQYGEARYYLNQTETYNGRYYWEQLSSEVNFGEVPPYIYEFVFTTTGNEVDSEINLIDLSSEIVNLPNYLFLGYRNKSTIGSLTMRVKITKLEIELNK